VFVSRDVERLGRLLQAQRLEPEYIRHYLQETYQLDQKTIDALFTKLGIGRSKGHIAAAKQTTAATGKGEQKTTKTSYY
jgi:hypothetical protein